MTPVGEALERYLDLSSLEVKLTAQNMANVDTPGYRTVGFDFAEAMKQLLPADSQTAGFKGALQDPDAVQQYPRVGPVGGLLERPDGNDVSMDREGMKMAEAQLEFRTGVELLRHEFTRMLDAIHEDEK
jgi:flagellar basal-body rod protein FlgB